MLLAVTVSLVLSASSSLPARDIQHQRLAGQPAPDAARATGARAIDPAALARLRVDSRPLIDLEIAPGETVRLSLTPIEVATPDAMFVIASRTRGGVVERPIATDVRIFRGAVEGRPDARAVVASADGFLGGFITLPDGEAHRTIWLSSGPHGKGLVPVAFDASRADPAFLPAPGDFCHSDELVQPDVVPPGGSGGVAGAPPCREILLAIDTDVEYTANVFGGNESLALAYAVALTAAASEIYTEDLNVRLRVRYIRLWEGQDPWTQTSTTNQLYEYRDYWVANEAAIERDLGHFLSGRSLGGGVAWLPGLCGNETAFGLSANLGGSFPYPLVENSGANWDIIVFSHELGHNFGSPHTHSYDPPLDGCGNGDCSQAAQGTIMSYCHLCDGGLANMALHFHPGNVESILALLDSAECVVTTEESGAFAADDYLSALPGDDVTVQPLDNDARMNCEEVSIVAIPDATVQGAPILAVPGLPGGPPTFVVQIPPDATEDDAFTYSIADTSGDTDSATVHIDVLPLAPPTAVVGTEPGANVSYFAIPQSSVLPDFAALDPYLVTSVPNVHFPSTNGPFATSGQADLVAAVFEGWVDVPAPGLWAFHSESDDGSKLYVNGQLVVSNDGLHGMVEKSGSLGLQAGKHLVRIEFFENFGGAGEIARWQGPGVPKSVIPPEAWSRNGRVVLPADLNADGSVDGADLAIVLGAWGSSGPGDINGDGTVDGADLAIVLGSWS